MNSNDDGIKFIDLMLKKVKNGIGKGIWQCNFYTQDLPKGDTDVRYWAVTATSSDYIVEFGYEVELTSHKVGDYWFSTKQNAKVVYQVRESDGSSNSPEFILMRDYMNILVEEYKKVVEALPK